MIKDYRIYLLQDKLAPEIELNNIILFKINDEEYKLNQFKSLDLAYKKIMNNIDDITYINFRKNSLGGYYIIEYYLKNRKLHRIEGPAHIIKLYEDGYFILKEKYYINDKEFTKENWIKKPEIREIKLKRILKN